MPGFAADLDLVLEFHRDHGSFDVTTTERTAHGHWLRVRCPCGVLFERYVTAADAEVDLITGTLEQFGEQHG